MLKKILIGVVVLVAILGAAYAYLNHRNRTLSPPGDATAQAGDLTVSIAYSRPSARGRLIFGTTEQKALQPYGQYWRLGANESTEITFNHDVSFHGSVLKQGTYRIYAVPGADQFEIIVNTELGRWGAFEPDHAYDILHIHVPVEHLTAPVEQFTVTLQAEGSDIVARFAWSDIQFSIPIKKA